MTERALVLGGGGITGIAWMLGMVAGLAERGVDLRAADDVLGTSAGSVVGAQLTTGVDVEERYAAQLADPTGEIAASPRPVALLRLGAAALAGRWDAQRVRARIGRAAARISTVPEQDRIDVIAGRLPVHAWPERTLRITVVDAADGALRVLDRNSGVPLVTAVAASCAVPGVWPPVTAGGRRYVDGGVRTPANADLAAGAERIVVLAPLARGLGRGSGVEAQVAGLRAAGAQVALVTPDAAALAAIGRNVLDPAKRAGAARAGRAQAATVTDAIAGVWTPSSG